LRKRQRHDLAGFAFCRLTREMRGQVDPEVRAQFCDVGTGNGAPLPGCSADRDRVDIGCFDGRLVDKDDFGAQTGRSPGRRVA
jgi:hypothetical protein